MDATASDGFVTTAAAQQIRFGSARTSDSARAVDRVKVSTESRKRVVFKKSAAVIIRSMPFARTRDRFKAAVLESSRNVSVRFSQLALDVD